MAGDARADHQGHSDSESIRALRAALEPHPAYQEIRAALDALYAHLESCYDCMRNRCPVVGLLGDRVDDAESAFLDAALYL
jgi:hypothetical protein